MGAADWLEPGNLVGGGGAGSACLSWCSSRNQAPGGTCQCLCDQDIRGMLTVRVGKMKMARQNLTRWMVRCLLVLVPVVILISFILQKSTNPFTVFPADWRRALSEGFYMSNQMSKMSSEKSTGSCTPLQVCSEDHLSFFIQSGAANVVGPRICVQNELVLGTALNNAGSGINIVIVNGKTGEVTKHNHFNMYSGEVEPLIKFLKDIEMGSVVLMASYDEPSSKLNDEAKKLISELGSTKVQSLGYRDSWVFVGGKGATVKTNFEKYLKNDKATNKYEDWPEVIELHGCIPKFLE